MKFAFTLHDVKKISSSTYVVFIGTVHYQTDKFDSDLVSDESDFNLLEMKPDIFECDKITPKVETLVKNN